MTCPMRIQSRTSFRAPWCVKAPMGRARLTFCSMQYSAGFLLNLRVDVSLAKRKSLGGCSNLFASTVSCFWCSLNVLSHFLWRVTRQVVDEIAVTLFDIGGNSVDDAMAAMCDHTMDVVAETEMMKLESCAARTPQELRRNLSRGPRSRTKPEKETIAMVIVARRDFSCLGPTRQGEWRERDTEHEKRWSSSDVVGGDLIVAGFSALLSDTKDDEETPATTES